MDLVAHKAWMREAGATAREERIETEKATVEEMMEGVSKMVSKRLPRIGKTS